MSSQKIEFHGHLGNTIAGVLELPEKKPSGIAIFAHCFTCTKELKVVREVARQFTRESLGVLRFDFTGLGQSKGLFQKTSFSTNIQDLLAAAEYLDQNHLPPVMLIGHSLGGAAALGAAGAIKSLRCVATIGAPAHASHIRGLLGKTAFGSDGTAMISVGGRLFKIERQFVEDLEKHSVLEHTASLRLPLMIFHSPVDQIVGIENAEQLYRAARHPKSFVSLGQSDHLVSKRYDAQFLGHVLSAWATYYIS